MAAIVSLDAALRDARLFRGGRALAPPRPGLPSGIPELDEALPWGGFPRGALTELLHAADGIGEFELLLPALRRLMQRERIALIAPPYLPYAPALRQAGLPLESLAWIAPPPERALWAAEQCLRAGCLGGVLLWNSTGDDRVLRRLQLAAEQGDAHAWLFRPARHAANASPAALRLEVERAQLAVLKCRGAVLRGVFLRGRTTTSPVFPPPLQEEGRDGEGVALPLPATSAPSINTIPTQTLPLKGRASVRGLVTSPAFGCLLSASAQPPEHGTSIVPPACLPPLEGEGLPAVLPPLQGEGRGGDGVASPPQPPAPPRPGRRRISHRPASQAVLPLPQPLPPG